MARRWKGRDEGLRESVRIADECVPFSLDWMRPPLPDFRKAKLGAGMSDRDDDEVLRTWTYEGARERWGSLSREQHRQLEHELALIKRLGFAGFFLVMADAGALRARTRTFSARGAAARRTPRSRTVSPSPLSIR